MRRETEPAAHVILIKCAKEGGGGGGGGWFKGAWAFNFLPTSLFLLITTPIGPVIIASRTLAAVTYLLRAVKRKI